jgi:Bacterial regulatory proteins, lacI family
LATIATISDIASDAGVSVDAVLRVLNREEPNNGVVARVADVLESHGFRVPHHLRAATSEGSAEDDERGAGTRPLPAADSDQTPSASIAGEVVETAPALMSTDIEGGGPARARDLVQAMLQAAEGGASGLPGSLRYQSLEIRPLAERMTVVDQLLERLVEDVHAAKDELRRGRSERVEDLALLVDLITASWRAVEQRLNRLERKVDESLRVNGAPGPVTISQPSTGDEAT